MNKYVRQCAAAFVLVSAVLSLNGCGGQLRRTSTDQWKTFSDSGVQIEVPADANVDGGPSGPIVQMHPLSPPTFTLADTQYLLVLRVQRMPEAEIVDQLRLLNENVPRTADNEWRYWMTERHATIAVSDHGEYSYYRYDRDCGGGNVLRADVELRHASKPDQFDTADDRAIRRMLQSLRCIDNRS